MAPTSSPPGLSPRLTRQALQYLSVHGLSAEALCQEVGLRLEEFEDPELRIPYTLLDTLLERAVALTGDERLGLHVARARIVDPEDPAALVILTSATLKESMVRGVRYQRIWGDGERFQVEETATGVRMRFTPVGPWRPAHRQLAELTLAQFAEGVRILTGTEVRPLQVRFVHPAPEDTREHEAVFGGPVVFGAPHNDVELSHEDAARPLVHADAVVNAIFEHQAKQALERLPVTESTAGRVRHQLQRSLAGGDFSFAAIARALHTPERTLQRRLASEGQSYAALLEGVRRELSTAYLHRSYSIAEVSFLLGYSDPSVFHRAFKRWWGKSPEAFRKAQADGGARRPPA